MHTTSRWTIRRAQTLALAAGFVALVATSACSSDASSPVTSPPAATPTGNYSMSTVNGQALPFAVAQDGSYKYEVTAGTVNLTTDGRFAAIVTYRQTIPGNVSMFVDSSAGTWAQSGSKITLLYSDATVPADTAAWSGNTLTLVGVSNKVATTTVYKK